MLILDAVDEAGERELGIFLNERAAQHLLEHGAGFRRQVERANLIQRSDEFLLGHRLQALLETHHRPHVAHAAALLHFRELGGDLLPIERLLVFRRLAGRRVLRMRGISAPAGRTGGDDQRDDGRDE